jgi:pimeloyl-ACP methyl ester carboxylesterase
MARAWPAGAKKFLHRRLRAHRAQGEGVVDELYDLAYEERANASLACFIEAGAVLNAFDSQAWLHELSVPTAVVVTTADRTVPPWRQDSLAALVPGARRLTVDAGHDAVIKNADAFLPVLRQACVAVGAQPTEGPGKEH